MRRKCNNFQLLLIIILIPLNDAYFIEQPQLHVNDNTFRLSIEDDPDIKWVEFHVNINQEFHEFEKSQLECTAELPINRQWICEFERKLEDRDIIYTWLMIQHNQWTYRARKNPFSVGALRRGDRRNYILTTTTTELPYTPLHIAIGHAETTNLPLSSVSNDKCYPSVTVIENAGDKRICQNQLIFDDDFKEFNNAYWTNEVRIPSTRFDSEFVIYNGSVAFNDGLMKFSAQLSELSINKEFDLGVRCTSKNLNECHYEPKLHHFLPPVTSGRINSAKYFNFKYGRIEVRAKVPKGDWLFPLIALEPTHNEYGSIPFENGEMRIAFVRGNKNLIWNDQHIDGTYLYGGAFFSRSAEERHQFMVNCTLAEKNIGRAAEHFGDSFHVYSLTWKPNELSLSVDNISYGKILTDFKNSLNISSWANKAANVPLDQMFYITLGLSAGGHGDFPEKINKPWENTYPKAIRDFFRQRQNWTETWTQPSLEIDYVRVYAV